MEIKVNSDILLTNKEQLSNLYNRLNQLSVYKNFSFLTLSRGRTKELVNADMKKLAETRDIMNDLIQKTISFIDIIATEFTGLDMEHKKKFENNHLKVKK